MPFSTTGSHHFLTAGTKDRTAVPYNIHMFYGCIPVVLLLTALVQKGFIPGRQSEKEKTIRGLLDIMQSLSILLQKKILFCNFF